MEFYIFPAVISYSTSPLATFPTDRHVFAFARHLLYLHRNRLSAYSPIYGGEHRDTIFNLSSNNALPPLSLSFSLSFKNKVDRFIISPPLSLSLSLQFASRLTLTRVYIYICMYYTKKGNFVPLQKGEGSLESFNERPSLPFGLIFKFSRHPNTSYSPETAFPSGIPGGGGIGWSLRSTGTTEEWIRSCGLKLVVSLSFPLASLSLFSSLDRQRPHQELGIQHRLISRNAPALAFTCTHESDPRCLYSR